MSVIERECYQLPCRKLVGFTTNGASVLISPRNGVIALLRQKVGNPKLFSQHCSPHHLVLAAKAGQHHIPDSIEQTVSETLIFFRDSPVRWSEFEDFLELTDPDNVYCQIVQYHKVRWLSFSDCVNRLVSLLPLLVQWMSTDVNSHHVTLEKCLTSLVTTTSIEVYVSGNIQHLLMTQHLTLCLNAHARRMQLLSISIYTMKQRSTLSLQNLHFCYWASLQTVLHVKGDLAA